MPTRRIGDLVEPACAIFTIVIAAVVVTGWLTGQLRLASIAEGLPPAKVNAALAFLLLGTALLLRAGSHDRRNAAVGTVLAIAAGCIGLATLAEYATGVNLGIDELIVVDRSGVGTYPGRMAFLMTAAISLVAGSVILHGRAGGAGYLRWLLALGAFTAGYVSLLGLLFGALEFETGFGLGPQLGLPAALSTLALGLAGFACSHEPSPTSILLSSTPGARVARVLVLAGLVGLPAVGWLNHAGQETGVFSSQFVTVATVVTGAILVASVGLWAGTWADRLQRAERLTLERTSKSERRYRGLLEAAPDAMVVVNESGEIALLNHRAEKEFGYHRDELVGQPVTNIIPAGFAERIIADDLRSAADALAQQIGTGLELVALRRDGTEFPIELMLSPLEGPDGILVTAAIRDITVRRAVEGELSRTSAYLENLIGYANVPIIVWSPDQRITQFNRAFERLSQRSSLEIVGQTLDVLFPSGSRDTSLARLGFAAKGESLESVEIPILRADGAVRAVLWNSANIYDAAAGGGLLAVIAQGQDITERKAAEEELSRKTQELIRSNEELGQFAYIASHDLQEPLRMVASYTQLLSRRYTGRLDADADEFIAFAVDGASRMQRLIEDLLAYSRVGTRGLDLVCTSSEVAFGRALLNLRGSIEESGAKVTHDPLPEVLADEHQLVQLFQNLVGNAIKYRRSGVPRVHVSVVGDPNRNWRYAVKDNGIGIDPQYFEKIFGMFQRLHRRDEFAGTGIGLAICKKIVERHGGTISVESKPGHGSTFHFTLAGNGAQP